MTPYHETAGSVTTGDGTAVVREFVVWARDHDVLVVGGLPARFADSPVPDATRLAIRSVFLDAGARFIAPPDSFPQSAFFDLPDHLNEPAQIEHLRFVAAALGRYSGASMGTHPVIGHCR